MKKLLHIIATPRGQESRTLQITEAFLAAFGPTHADWVTEELDLTREALPSLTMKRVDGKYVLLGGGELYGELKEAWDEIIAHIRRFLSADAYLLSTPMWNFGIPYPLKHYIDIIVQPTYLFHYVDDKAEGLVRNKKLLVIATRGGEYGPGSGAEGYDFQVPYLRTIFGFVGLTDVRFIVAQPMDMDIDRQRAMIEQAKEEAVAAAGDF